jgi:ribonuclease E
MPNKMLIDAAHPEETRVVVLRGNRVEEFDFESASRKQLRGNIYLAKVTRVEPSLQAAFIDYGGNRHGFLAFSEIHPDYYQIPVADRQALIEAEEAEIAEAEARQAERDRGGRGRGRGHGRNEGGRSSASAEAGQGPGISEAGGDHDDDDDGSVNSDGHVEELNGGGEERENDHADDTNGGNAGEMASTGEAGESSHEAGSPTSDATASDALPGDHAEPREANGNGASRDEGDHVVSDDAVESVGAEDAMEEVPERRKSRVRQYKIQEVIKRRQVLLVQVVKEERGNKGAALTTYLSLAGRYSVLMPNTARGGGISRKITSITDRKRLKQVVSDLEVPAGMGVILRTAGASRTRAEVKRDFEYLMRLWGTVRELTLKSSAPALVYEEGSLIKRSIRDLYNKDIDEVLVAGDDAYREAKDFMRMLMPSHAKNVKPYKDGQPLFARSGIEAQLDAMFSPQVTLRSGGYTVINQTEALVAIDVNSGRSTREHNIEDTALQTNLEAAEEVARQLRLRDLAGLIVIDFIDMEEKRNNRSVERKLKDALKNDRARIQVGRISHFGLLEMSRQRIRTGVLESTTTSCPTCQGTGHIRAPASVALHVLRSLEDQLLKGVTHNLTIRTRTVVALYILNQKRATLAEVEQRFGLTISVMADETISNGAHFLIERGEPVAPRDPLQIAASPAPIEPEVEPADVEPDVIDDADEDVGGGVGEVREFRSDSEQREGPDGQRRGRRRRRGRGRGEGRPEGGQRSEGGQRPEGNRAEGFRADAAARSEPSQHSDTDGEMEEADADGSNGAPVGQNGGERPFVAGELGPDGLPRKRRRGRRGGRRGRRGRGGEGGAPGEQQPQQHNRQNGGGEQRPAMDSRPPRADSPRPYEGNTFGGTISSDYEDIDTTPTLEARPAHQAPRRIDMQPPQDLLEGEVDTTPQPIERPAEVSSSEPANSAQPASKPEAEPEAETEDPNRPKRNGWWQRKSFF